MNMKSGPCFSEPKVRSTPCCHWTEDAIRTTVSVNWIRDQEHTYSELKLRSGSFHEWTEGKIKYLTESEMRSIWNSHYYSYSLSAENDLRCIDGNFWFSAVGKCYIMSRQHCIIIINPIALRKAKIVYNFGLSECDRVNLSSQTHKCYNTEYKLVCQFSLLAKTARHIWLLLRLSTISCYLLRLLYMCMINGFLPSLSTWPLPAESQQEEQLHGQSRQEAIFMRTVVSAGSNRSRTVSEEAKYEGQS